MTNVLAHVDALSQDEIANLMDMRGDVCVSIYMPTVRAGDQTRQNAIRFGNLRSAAGNKLIARGWRKPEIDALLESLDDVDGGDIEFWQHQSDGLCVILTPSQLKTLRLPQAFDEMVWVQSRPHVVPLLALLNWEWDKPFYLLALNLAGIRLYRGSARHLEPVKLNAVPLSLDDYMRYTEREKQLQHHASGQGGAAMFHGHGAGGDVDTRKEDIREFFRQVENAVSTALNTTQAPLILAGTETNVGIYREVNQYPYLGETRVAKNPADMRDADLYAAGAEIVDKYYGDAAQEARDRLEHLRTRDPGHVADGIEQVSPAAYYRRVDKLFVPENFTQWGAFDEADGRVRVETQEKGEELVNLAVIHTLSNGGRVIPVAADARLSAILRY